MPAASEGGVASTVDTLLLTPVKGLTGSVEDVTPLVTGSDIATKIAKV